MKQDFVIRNVTRIDYSMSPQSTPGTRERDYVEDWAHLDQK